MPPEIFSLIEKLSPVMILVVIVVYMILDAKAKRSRGDRVSLCGSTDTIHTINETVNKTASKAIVRRVHIIHLCFLISAFISVSLVSSMSLSAFSYCFKYRLCESLSIIIIQI